MLKISDYLSIGEKDAISLEQLSIATGLPERSVRREVLNARISGELICSSDAGYFLPESVDDLKHFVFTRKAAIKTANKALQPFIRAMRQNG